ncbi:hypothetical protein CWI38_0018p0030 [Hamiltosporidium tvaerminnensis]|uniref:Uncharacterized protein n=2 Tax=Hamiltosporidium TaxID=1176354 RepID=A0A4Q9L393_9MICR|nr:hypothetical protein CWI39_1400p0010 [Hamiltosporidium magnivora]TBU01908.1 hypothetical protein CWI36_1234p0010 [Hamiltosporidium magnivora]TBU05063.1 hypothetical protein CWI37_0054p0070 [Hamiltosporidium tvaerminnensis]TBU20831.1 hypothetical protein CWI38_0018p0030 [Hamiltosporidium tvaerminnensis]
MPLKNRVQDTQTYISGQYSLIVTESKSYASDIYTDVKLLDRVTPVPSGFNLEFHTNKQNIGIIRNGNLINLSIVKIKPHVEVVDTFVLEYKGGKLIDFTMDEITEKNDTVTILRIRLGNVDSLIADYQDLLLKKS